MTELMTAAPVAPENQVTLANWRQAPFNKWGFHHVSEIVPTAEIRTNGDARTPLPIAATGLSGLAGITVSAANGDSLDLEGFLAVSDTDGLVVLKEGAIIAEHYAHGMTPDSPHILMSVSKSVLGLIAGILSDQGVLDLSCPVERILPEVAATAFAGASLQQLLDMRVGIDFDEDYLATEGPIIAYRKATNWNPLASGDCAGDLRQFFTSLTAKDGQHGRNFHYVSPNTDLLGWVIERASGMRYADLVSELLWQPLGARRSAQITVDRLGAPRAAGGVCTSTRDLALLGQMVAQEGAIGSQQIVPAAWIADITHGGAPDAWATGSFAPAFAGRDMHYRNKWYVQRAGDSDGPLLFCVGVHGQNLFVDPARHLVIAKFSSQALPLDPALIPLTSRWVDAVRAAF